MEVLVKNRKTGQLKRLPHKVYQQLKQAWILIDEGNEVDEDIKKKIGRSGNVLPVIEIPTSENTGDIVIIDNTGHVNDIAEYAQLTGGKKADGRWSPEKLKSKIQELKNN